MNTERFVDLHVHTSFSDGTFSPEEVVKVAGEKGLAAVAICDHDCLDGIGPAMEAARKTNGIEVVPGIELTAEERDREVHILGFFMDWRNEAFKKKLEKICQARVERAHKMIKKIKDLGLCIDGEEVFKLSGPGAVGRLHLARAMYNQGLVGSIEEAFRKYISDSGPAYVKKFRFTPCQAIEEIIKVKGVPVLAHPYSLSREEIIPEMVKCGLRGLEAYHPDHSAGVVKHFAGLAEKFGIITTGGSDCHGEGRRPVAMGNAKVPYAVLEKLKDEAKKIAG